MMKLMGDLSVNDTDLVMTTLILVMFVLVWQEVRCLGDLPS
jgi:hypothetical protein